MLKEAEERATRLLAIINDGALMKELVDKNDFTLPYLSEKYQVRVFHIFFH